MQPLVDLRREPSDSAVEASVYASDEIRAMQGAVANIFARWGVTPVELLLRGGMGDLERLRRYLDSVRGGW